MSLYKEASRVSLLGTKMLWTSKSLNALPWLSGGVAVFLGLAVIYGWLTHNITLVQVLPALPQMRFNTALCFVFSGVGLLGLLFKKEGLALACSVPITLITLLTLFQYVSGLNMGIDEFFFKGYLAANTSYPGRMAPNTAICFFLLSLSQLLLACFGQKYWPIIAALAFCLIAFCNAMVALIGYQWHFVSYQWFNAIQIAVHTCVGLIITSGGLLYFIGQHKLFKKTGMPYWHEALVCFLSLFLTFSLWNSLLRHEEEQALLLTQQRMLAFKSELSSLLKSRFQALERIARRWEFVNGTPQSAWQDDVQHYLDDQSDYQGIGWVDNTYQVRWLYPKKGNEKARHFNLATEPKRYAALLMAKKNNMSYVSRTVTLLNGTTGFVYFVPLHNANGKFDGFITGGYDLNKLMHSLLKENAQLLNLTISDDGQVVYVHSPENGLGFTVHDTFLLKGIQWDIRLKLASELIRQVRSPLPTLVLLFGILFSGLLTWVVYSTKRIKQQSALLRQSEAQLGNAIDYSAIGMALVSLDGQWMRVNKALLKILGYCEAELLATTFQAITHPDDIEADLYHVGQLVRQQIDNYQLEKRYRHKNGHYVWAQLNASLVCNSEGKPEHFIAQVQDITQRRSMEALIRKSATRFEAIFNQTYQFIGILSVDGTVQDINRSALEASGCTNDAVMGKYFWETPWWTHSQAMQNQLKDAIQRAAKGEFIRFEATHPTPAGDIITVDFSLKPVLDENNQVILLVPEGRDISHIKQAERELERANRSLKDIKQALDVSTIVAITDVKGTITYANDAFCQISQYSREELLGQNHRIVNSGFHTPEFFRDMWRTLGQGHIWHNEIRNRAKDGTDYWVDTTIVPLFNEASKIEQYVAIRHDITDTKRLEESLVEAKQASEQANRFKSEFLANMSHEIRTPMNGILGMTEITLNTLLTKEQRHYLQMVYSSGTTLLALINDILDFSKIEAGKLELDPIRFKLQESIEETLYPFISKASDKEIELLCDISPKTPNLLMGDITRIRQIVVNLIGNALKFTHQGEILLGIEPAEMNEKEVQLHFWVKDTGIGMTPEQQNRIFTPFSQADSSTTRKYGGTGLGLSITLQLIELMGGRLWLESVPEQGSTFHFCLPLEIAEDFQPSSLPIPLEELVSTRVLVVDDNHTNLKIMEEMLRHWHMLPTLLDDPEQAISELERALSDGHPYPLVLTDYGMPRIDGYTLARQIKNTPNLTATKIIVLSSYGQAGEARLCKASQVDGYLSKPVSQPVLLGMIRRVLGNLDASPETVEPLITRHELRENRKALKLLLAEDNEVNQAVALQILRSAGHSVVIVTNGIEAVTAYQQDHFDLVLMDIHMPEMDGYEATAQIRQLEATTGNHVPIIALTANAFKGDKARCLEAGMDSYLSKPFKRDELLNTLDAFASAAASITAEKQTAPLSQRPSFPEQELREDKQVDPRSLMARFGEDLAMLVQFYTLFCEHCPDQLRAIQEAVQQQDSTALNESAHKLKGAIANFTTGSAYLLAARLEQAGRDKQLLQAQETVTQLENSLHHFDTEIKQFIKGVTAQ